MKMIIRSIGIIILTTFALALTSCSSDDDPAPQIVNISGTWSIDTVETGNCPSSLYPEYKRRI